jgi:hypothetical protein
MSNTTSKDITQLSRPLNYEQQVEVTHHFPGLINITSQQGYLSQSPPASYVVTDPSLFRNTTIVILLNHIITAGEHLQVQINTY